MTGEQQHHSMHNLWSTLKAATKRNEVARPSGTDDGNFQRFYDRWKSGGGKTRSLSYRYIPKFYTPCNPTSEEDAVNVLREVARLDFIKTRGDELLNDDELRQFCLRLEKLASRGDGRSLSYAELKTLTAGSSKLTSYFKPSGVYELMKQENKNERISVADLLNYVTKKTWLIQSKIGLLLYDVRGYGVLTEVDLKRYITALIPTLPPIEKLNPTIWPIYIIGAVRKFMFFLDPLRTGKVKIRDILISTFLEDILDLRCEGVSSKQLEMNWFSTVTTLRVYGQFLFLDSDHNGKLNKVEFKRFGSGTLTTVFIDRIFQECVSSDGEMDYKTYVELVLALENRNEPQSLQYLFRILDINRCGYLDGFALNYFFREVQMRLAEESQEPASFADIKDEIFDMIRPADPTKITLKDLVSSGQGDLAINILIELNSFYSHENQEPSGSQSSGSP